MPSCGRPARPASTPPLSPPPWPSSQSAGGPPGSSAGATPPSSPSLHRRPHPPPNPGTAYIAPICPGGERRRDGTAGESGLPAVAATEHPSSCPACALTRWQRVATTTTTTAAAGWRTARNHFADLGETTAEDETSHDCTRPAGGLTDDEDRPVPGYTARPERKSRTVPLFCAIDRRGTPQTGYPVSTRSVTAIVAARLAAAAHTGRGRPATTVPERPGDPATWGSDDHARVVAARHTATDRLASFEADLDEADAYAEAILARLDAERSD